MYFSDHASLFGTASLSGPKNSIFNAIEDALTNSDLTHAYIDTHDLKYHIVGQRIREISQTTEYKVYKNKVLASSRTRD